MKTNLEEIFYEGGPAKVDLYINLLAGITLVGLPFTFGALVRALWLRYKITNRRVSVIGGWFGKNQSEVAQTYRQALELCKALDWEISSEIVSKNVSLSEQR